MKLRELLSALGETAVPGGDIPDAEVAGLAHDSRKVVPGSVFVAVRGFHSDGHRFIPQALKQGAMAIVAERSGAAEVPADAPAVFVEDSRKALALLAAAFFGHPSRRLRLIGVTGTNGKTTTAYLVKSVAEAAGGAAGLIGTIDYRVGDRIYPAPNTTPESLELQRLLSEMVGAGASSCVMEVSSHALELGRTAGCDFTVAAFTNLTQDHLDFHGTMESYFEAKLALFTGLSPHAHAVINLDDARAVDVIGATRAGVITTGVSGSADVRPAGALRHGIEGLAFLVETPVGAIAVESPLVGRHNVSNILTAVGVGVAMGLPPEAISEGIANMKAVPGRMEKVGEGRPFSVIVDYAHTEDALVRLLEAARELAEGRIITVFGCGGDRDRTKRPKMGAAAARGSDAVIVTSDNPRTEEPGEIIEDIESGMSGAAMKVSASAVLGSVNGKTPYAVVADRREAIAAAIAMARPGDIVVLAGKGHEDYQIIGAEKVHFDDREVAREELGKLGHERF